MGRTVLGIFIGILIGIISCLVGMRVLTPTIVVEGVVEYEAPNPGATAVPPEGFYIRSRIYVDGTTRESVGKNMTLKGRLSSVSDADNYNHYPKLVPPDRD